jgi:hypothetical protein
MFLWKEANPEAMFDFKNHVTKIIKISQPTSSWVTGKIKITEKGKNYYIPKFDYIFQHSSVLVVSWLR